MRNAEMVSDDMVKLPYGDNLYICPNTLQRWMLVDDTWERDLDGEDDWIRMGSYVGQNYVDVATKELQYARNK